MNNKNASAIYIKLILVQFFWAGTFVASEIALSDLSSGITALIRFILTTLCYIFLCILLNKNSNKISYKLCQLTTREWGALFLMGFFGVAIYTLLLHIGLSLTTAALAALLIPTTQPIFTALISSLISGEKIKRSLIFGVLLGFIGASLILLKGDINDELGNWIIIAAAISFSCYAVSSMFAPKSLSTIENTTISFCFGTLVLIPVPYIMSESYSLLESSSSFWIAIIYLVIFATVLPYLWWNEAVKSIGPSRTGIFTFLMPPLALVMSILILGHEITTIQFIGGSLAMLGVAFSMKNN